MTQAAMNTIGNAGNAADANGSGAVAYTYQISATEVTIAEFTASGAGNGDENYWNDGIRTVGSAAPASFVTLDEAMKYCNFMTSGNVDDGAYVFSGGVYQSTDRASAITAYGTVYALPTEDEWCKAAYFDASGAKGYSLYANGTDTIPTWGTTAGWNYYDNAGGFVSGSPNYAWTAGYGGVEQNGTFDMMGNVWEWMESPAGLIRGGSYTYDEPSLISSEPSHGSVTAIPVKDLGFRVVAIPEPASAMMIGLGGLLIAGYRCLSKFYGRF
jgi:formylglycine-generating enzyme required for sulfatase activity